MTQRMIRGVAIAMVALAIAGFVFFVLAGPKRTRADGPVWTYDWWTDGSGEVIVYRVEDSWIVFYADLSTPYGITSTFEGVSPTEGHFNGSEKRACETAVYVDRYSGYASLSQGRCGWPGVNPYLRPKAEGGTLVPVSSASPRPYLSIWEPIGVDADGRNVYYQVFADAKTLELVVQVLKTNPEGQPGVGSTIEVRNPRGQALELLVDADVGGWQGAISLMFWNDQDGWKFVRSDSPTEGEPLWSLWSSNRLQVRANGQAWYTELPYLRRPAAA